MKKKKIAVVGMACAGCAAGVQKCLRSCEGVEEANVNFATRTVLISFDDSVTSLDVLQDKVRKIGFDLVIDDENQVEDVERRELHTLYVKTLLAWLFAALSMALTMQWIEIGDGFFTNQILLIIAMTCLIICGMDIYKKAFSLVVHGMTNMDTLVTMSTLVTFLFSVFSTFYGDSFFGSRGITWHVYFDTVCMILAFVLTGRLLEEKAKRSTATSIRSLMNLKPKTAIVIVGGERQEVPLATVQKNDVLEVVVGNNIPVDGVVVEGMGKVDESMLTGESELIEKSIGDMLTGGTVCLEGKLLMKAKAVGRDTVLSQVIKRVDEALGSKAPIERITDRAASVFVPVVFCLSVVTFLLWFVNGGVESLAHALMSAVSVLVVACPCAMGLATPTALMVGIGKAAQYGILIKDASALEIMCRLKHIVFDKTGTITMVKDGVEQIKPHTSTAISRLRNIGIGITMISGDKQQKVSYWADCAGIADFMAEVRPEDKLNAVTRLQEGGNIVGMVGDGVNDSEALAQADVSIAIGGGTDVAMDVAQITLLSNDLRMVPVAVILSRKTSQAIRQNLFWAFIYNIICIPVAAGLPGVFGAEWEMTPMVASALMAMSSVSVVLNSLRLRWSCDNLHETTD